MSIQPSWRRAVPFCLAISIALLVFAFGTPVSAHPPHDDPLPKFTLKNPCAQDPNNLIYNGSMATGSPADGWTKFVIEGNPGLNHVDNEQIDALGSVQIFSTGTFDAGLYQTVRNLQPGVYYGFRLGYSLAAKSYSGPNVRVDSIGRKVGVDPLGGTDPKSPNVIWGPDFFDGNAALNIPQMQMIFAARSSNATIFLRAMARDGSSGENRVWFDAVCMQAQSDMPTATPAAPTATPVPPTATVRPTVKPTVKAATPLPPTFTPTPTSSPTPTYTPTPTGTATPIPTPRYARPVPTAAPEGPLTLNADTLAGVGLGSIVSSMFMFAFGIVLARRPG